MSWTRVCSVVQQWVVVFPSQYPKVTLSISQGKWNLPAEQSDKYHNAIGSCMYWPLLLTIAGKCCRLQVSDVEGSQWVNELLCTSLFWDHLLARKTKNITEEFWVGDTFFFNQEIWYFTRVVDSPIHRPMESQMSHLIFCGIYDNFLSLSNI